METLLEHLGTRRSENEFDRGMNLSILQNRSGRFEICDAPVGTTPHHHLVDLLAFHIFDSDDLVMMAGPGHDGSLLAKIRLETAQITRIRIGA